MNTLARILDIASHYTRMQAKIAARQVDQIITATAVKIAAILLLIAAAAVLLVALYMALAIVLHPAGAMTIVGVLIALLGGITLRFALTMGQSPRV